MRTPHPWPRGLGCVAVTLAALLVAAPPAGAAEDYQAEDGAVSQGGVFTTYTGYTGRGYVDYLDMTGGFVQLYVTAATAGTVGLTYRYANGTTGDLPLDITVNGVPAASGVSFPPTGGWGTWQTRTVNATLKAGTNKVRAIATTAGGGPNLDRLTVAEPIDTQPPTTPGAPSCSGVTANSLTLTWGAATDDTGVVAYDILHDAAKLAEAPGNTTSKQLTGLSPATEYRLSVRARDAAGNVSARSTQAVCTTEPGSDSEPPTAPSGLAVSQVGTTSARLSWNASTDNVGVTAYEVRSGSNVYATVTGAPPPTSTTVTGLACDSPYSLTVVARDAAQNTSPPSTGVSFRTSPCSTDGGIPSGITTISTGWSIPWGTAFLPDGQSALVTERDTFRVHKVALDGTRTQVGTVPNAVSTGGEGGLMGVAVDPAWATNHYVYFMHTASEGNRIARMTYDGTGLSTYTVLVQGITKNTYHDGGRLAFGPDGYLYATTGDALNGNNAQDRNSLNGKILRMTTSGAPAPGNPWGTLVYSMGHRNPQGLAFDRNGRLWEAEFGNNLQDELNLITPGANYGWPTCEGACDVAGMTNPKATWPTSQASPSGIAIVRNVIYMAAQRGERLWRIPINGDSDTVGTPAAYYVGTYGRLRTVTKVPGADQLWLSTTNADNAGREPAGSDKIFRVTIT
ncbi:hypothetical protein Ssi03_08970 [Sphaerisporangium siamense]|uniref:Glucose/arabinose dehydrogenase n=1 Tax=Sphaerisporangium siamense TaxID=795645 RepID=A0A7W7DFB3_9ACTN|nr:PQQ-dependent sugar dehydrogenase [Sphaerisporangium siamense]MBB4705707.1 glucose/arabinose dehydrogenase [Sphaerisporangium siamense]GII82907.1 hypothetical protein Ssi03_08970 [Sphaerisporangium siamense]